MSRFCTRSTYLPYLSGSSIVSHGLTAPSANIRQAVEPEVLVEVGDRHTRIGERRRERVDRPVHAGRRVEQPAGRRRVEHRWAQRVQRAVADVERLAVHDPAAAFEREVEAVRVPFDHRPVAHELRVRARGHRLVEVAGVVDVVVREEDPAHVFGLHEREHVFEPLLAVRGRAGVDDHRLLAQDHHRVDVHEQRLPERRLHLVDHERVVRDLRRRRRRWSVRSARTSCFLHVPPLRQDL